MAIITGKNMGVDDTLRGTHSSDVISGLSGDDVIYGGRGEDTIVGGQGNDVLFGGLDADTFSFSAGHIGNGETDYIADFSLNQGDTLRFLDSGNGQAFEVLSIVRQYLTETMGVNGTDLRNNVETGTDIIFSVMNSVTGAVQNIVLLDAWSGNLSGAWDDYLASMGLSFSTSSESENVIS